MFSSWTVSQSTHITFLLMTPNHHRALFYGAQCFTFLVSYTVCFSFPLLILFVVFIDIPFDKCSWYSRASYLRRCSNFYGNQSKSRRHLFQSTRRDSSRLDRSLVPSWYTSHGEFPLPNLASYSLIRIFC